MRAMLESARQSIRNRAANVGGNAAPKKPRTLDAGPASSGSSHRHGHQGGGKAATAASPTASVADGGLHFPKNVPSGTGPEAESAELSAVNAQEGRLQFVRHYHRLLLAFIEDKSKYELELPNLSALDRVVVHALAEKCNLSHESAGGKSDRVMHLKKDILFFQHPEAAQHVNLEEIIEKVSWKESKFQIRYVRAANPAQVAVGDIGSYADEEALEKIERFRRATDEYRHATDMGYTQQELLLAEAGASTSATDPSDASEAQGLAVPGRLEEILSRPDGAGAAAGSPVPPPPASPTAGPTPTGGSADTSTIAVAMAKSKAAAAAARTSSAAAAATIKTVHDEVCRSCGTRVRLDGPPQGWKCSHFCAHCTRQTIWSLEEVKVRDEAPAKASKRHRDAGQGDDGGAGARRRRAEPAVEEIDREDGAEEEGPGTASRPRSRSLSSEDSEGADALTAEDVVEVAATNDFSAKDTNWLRDFACRPTARLAEQIAFCIDFADLTDARLFRRYDAATSESSTRCWYVVLREVRALSLSVSDLLRVLLSEAFAAPAASNAGGAAPPLEGVPEPIQSEAAEARAMDHVGIAFPNLSVYGTECVAVCQLRPAVRWAATPQLPVQEAALQQLRQRYGAAHVFPTASLAEAVQHAGEAAPASASV